MMHLYTFVYRILEVALLSVHAAYKVLLYICSYINIYMNKLGKNWMEEWPVSHEYFLNSNRFQGKEKVADARRKELSKNTKSDHLTVVNAFTVRML